MNTLSADSATELFTTAVHAVLTQGTTVAPRGMATRELTGVHLQLRHPRRRFIAAPPDRLLNPAFAAAETVWILSGSDAAWIYTYNRRLRSFADDGVLAGAYGPRLRRWPGRPGPVDQLRQTRRRLIKDPDTRRAVIQLFDPARDHRDSKDIPCTLGYRFLLREGRLDMHTTMRSQDLWLGFCYDIFTATILHELMAGWVNAELGIYHHHVDSLHLYDEHLAAAHRVQGPPSPAMPSLTLPWDTLDTTLERVLSGVDCDHPGWQQFGDAMASYRAWREGDHARARDLARTTTCVRGSMPGLPGPDDPPSTDPGPRVLPEALLAWYAHLDHTSTTTAARR